VRRREKLLHDLEPDVQPGKLPDKLTTTEIILQLYFVDKKTTKEIMDIVMVSQQYVSKTILKYKPIIVENIKKSVVLRRKYRTLN
jgi:DNA-binding CsgD family transcriptional regulator